MRIRFPSCAFDLRNARTFVRSLEFDLFVVDSAASLEVGLRVAQLIDTQDG